MVETMRDPVGSGGNVHQTAVHSRQDSNVSGVSWSAIFAGTAGAAALSLILILLGTAFGLAAVSPWAAAGASAAAIGIGAILWLSLTHIVTAGLGGYLAGRLRVRWAGFNNDEVYFRDTVHGFLTWSIATLVTAGLIGALVPALGDQEGTAAEPSPLGAMTLLAEDNGRMSPWAFEYYAGALFHANGTVEPVDADTRQTAARVLEFGLVVGELEPEDRRFLAQLVAERTELNPEQAEQRVTAVYERAVAGREEMIAALDEAREAAAWTAGWMFIALLLGAFFASLAATYGGRHRDSLAEI